MSRKRSATCPPCATCADLKAKALAIHKAQERKDEADPPCACHNYRRTFCIAPSTEAWWTQERIAEYHDAETAFEAAQAEFDAALVALRESVL